VEKEKIQKDFQSSMNSMLHQQTLTEKEKQVLLKDLQKEKEIRLQYEESQFALKEKMKLLQNQIISGNQSLLTKAQKQEMELKALNLKLKEQQEQEMKLKQSLLEKEREKEMLEFEKLNEMEDHYLSLQDELTMKTSKLKKLYKNYQSLVRERNELQEELQEERRRASDVQSEQFSIIQLKELIIHHFIPEDYSQAIENKAVRVPEENDGNNHEMKWAIPHENLTGTSLRCSVDRPTSNQSLRRPETEFARQQRNTSNSNNNPRYSMENILILEFDRHGEKLTEPFVTDPKNMKNSKKMNKSKVDSYLTMNIYDDNDDHSGEVVFEEGKEEFPTIRYYSYGEMMRILGMGEKQVDNKTACTDEKLMKKDRPSSAARTRTNRSSSSTEMEMKLKDYDSINTNVADHYPQSRGLVRR
jgi:hypothetical protein